MSHVQKRGPNKYRARYLDPTGAEHSRTFRRKSDAESFLTSIDHSKLAGTYIDTAGGKIAFAPYAEQWRKIQVHRPGSRVAIESRLRNHAYPVIGKRALSSIRPTQIQSLVSNLASSHSPATVEVVYAHIQAVFKAAVMDGLIAKSPCMGVRLPKSAPTRVKGLLTTEQVQGLAMAVPERYRALVAVGAGAGLRPSEVFGLRADRVNWFGKAIVVDGQWGAKGRGGIVALKTSASYRTVPVAQVTLDILAAHIAAFPAIPGTLVGDLGLVFANDAGRPVIQGAYERAWRRGVGKLNAGLTANPFPTTATPHDLRHYYASVLIRSGASVKVVQARLGHASAKVTLDVYGHLWPEDDDETRVTMERELGGVAMERGAVNG